MSCGRRWRSSWWCALNHYVGASPVRTCVITHRIAAHGRRVTPACLAAQGPLLHKQAGVGPTDGRADNLKARSYEMTGDKNDLDSWVKMAQNRAHMRGAGFTVRVHACLPSTRRHHCALSYGPFRNFTLARAKSRTRC